MKNAKYYFTVMMILVLGAKTMLILQTICSYGQDISCIAIWLKTFHIQYIYLQRGFNINITCK